MPPKKKKSVLASEKLRKEYEKAMSVCARHEDRCCAHILQKIGSVYLETKRKACLALAHELDREDNHGDALKYYEMYTNELNG